MMLQRKLRNVGLLLGLLLGMQLGYGQCNGDPNLCNLRYDQVCYATTHNAFNYQGDFLFPNQSFPVAQQLQDGVRGFMLDVYWLNNQATVYHGNNFLGNQPLLGILVDIKTFLDQNPTEIVTIIFECNITAAQMADVFTQANLLSDVHAQPLGQAWPTLGTMVSNNQRLVVLTDENDGQAYPWYHYMWDYAVETHYTAHSRGDFSCNYNRGNAANSLFILNHFITNSTFGYGMIDSALAINDSSYLHPRALDCWSTTGKLPNFLTVDFHEQGDLIMVKDLLNGSPLVGVEASDRPITLSRIVPNPNQGSFRVEFGHQLQAPIRLTLHDAQGRQLYKKVLVQSPSGNLEVQLNFPFLPSGVYFLEYSAGEISGVERVAVMTK